MAEEGDQDLIDPRGYEKSYEVVARRLRRRIEGGEFRWHAPLPSEPALAEWYGVSRTTVRSAIECGWSSSGWRGPSQSNAKPPP